MAKQSFAGASDDILAVGGGIEARHRVAHRRPLERDPVHVATPNPRRTSSFSTHKATKTPTPPPSKRCATAPLCSAATWILKPDDRVTLEYRSDRVNLNTDANLMITRINCG